MGSEEEFYDEIATMVVDWAGRVAYGENTVDDTKQEMIQWVDRSVNRLWGLTLVSVGCVKEMMWGAVTAYTGGDLLVLQEGSWFIQAIQGPASQEPDVVAAMQTAIAMLNRDADMARDILIAHERVGGTRALFGVAFAATGALASLLEAGVWAGSGEDGPHVG